MALTLYYAPNTRATGVRILLEELGAPYEQHRLDLRAGENKTAAFLAVNPLGKVPTIVHDGAVVTEQGAIYAYLADAFPQAGLAPAIGDTLRGPYLRWLFFYGSAFEPAVVDVAMKRDAGRPMMSPYGSSEAVMDALEAQLAPGPYLLGERFTAADLLWGTALGWTIHFKIVPDRKVFTDYVARVGSRPAAKRVEAADAAG